MNAKQTTRKDIADLLSSIGKPGEKRGEKLVAIKDLGLNNFQGVPLEDSLLDYKEF